MVVVRVASGLAAHGGEVDLPRALVDGQQLDDEPGPLRDPVLHLPGGEVVQVEVSPALALREPDELAPVVEHAPVVGRAELVQLHPGVTALDDHLAGRARLRVDLDERLVLEVA